MERQDEIESLPPSVVVGGTLSKSTKSPECEEKSETPFVLVYGLSQNAVSVQNSLKHFDDLYSSIGSTGMNAALNIITNELLCFCKTKRILRNVDLGTKQESQTFDEDAFGSYVSDGGLLSDSVSIFSDMNMSDASGSTFILDAIPIDGEVPCFLQKKKGLNTSTPKKSENSKNIAKSAALGTALPKESPSLKTVIQKLSLPSEVSHCTSVDNLLPNPEGNLLVVQLTVGKSNVAAAAGTCGALLCYSVELDSKNVLLNKDFIAMKKIQSKEQLPTSASCFIPSDSGESMISMVLASGNVWILKLSEFTVMNLIERPGKDLFIRCISWVSSKYTSRVSPS
jgi:hypothetical protein